MTANGFIRRGPMAADVFERQFTRIHNAVFRDSRMSYKAKGIFGLISTHRDGFGLSIESLTSFSTDGASAVRTGLNELEAFGYLQRDQQRLDGPTKESPKAKKGSFGSVEYFITDMPDGLVISVPAPEGGEGGNPSSGPSCENRATEETPSSGPSCDFPRTDEPRAEDHRRKKINPQKTTSLSGAPVSPEAQESTPAQAKTRESDAAPKGPTDPSLPEPRSEALPSVRLVLDAYTGALGPVRPQRSVLDELTRDAEELVALDWPVEHLAKLAAQMPGLGFTSLAKHARYNPPPAPKAAPTRNSAMCERHPAFPADDCLRCLDEERQRARREHVAPATVDGAGLLARLRANQPVS
ncbi:hypothetical protein OG330_31025 (plasmid) [Streptomyces albidoflavus]|uniref:Uncharacterized protein n=1 Tax=Streptomyces albidoflavus TaxID=1886 RepID=A0A8G2E025_9ACTN|nr:hypothetical protein [Streptomyces albidoflavus]RZE15334.1 hypothetical protein C0Q92_31055 [Streptomyces albidoflavus]WSU19608.1 hypothetical protein OG330_31025 [Streptomyces albidoflavus]WTC33768.1 hypothetical protein OH749_31145 [Streptomyces albidoflavus]CAI4198579.1 hypothetical protein CCOS2040_31230 [Streptomyces albidoflavus]